MDESERPSTPMLTSDAFEGNNTVSPDGRWLAFNSNDTGRAEIYVVPFPDVASSGRVRLSRDGGLEPVWKPDGRGGPRNSDSLLRWNPDQGEGVWHATEETELPG